jgi:sugar/nucleoside kinase (ribokinase family)
VTLVTALPPGYDQDVLAGVRLRPTPASECPRYANSYDAAGNRTQLLLAEGAALAWPPADELAADAVIVAPAFHELGPPPALEGVAVVAVSLQGLLRAVDGQGRVRPRSQPIAHAAPFARAGWLLFFSDEDTEDAHALARQLAAVDAVAIVTRGHLGATLFTGSGERVIPAAPARAVDPTGAGDIFATAFTVRYVETEDLAAAGAFAAVAGALAVEGHGLAGIPTRGAVEARLRREAA